MSPLLLAVVCVALVFLGAMISVGKILYRGDKLKTSKSAGVVILGAATSLSAGALTIKFNDLPPITIIGVGVILGLIGAQGLEAIFKKWLKKYS